MKKPNKGLFNKISCPKRQKVLGEQSAKSGIAMQSRQTYSECELGFPMVTKVAAVGGLYLSLFWRVNRDIYAKITWVKQ